MAVAMVHMFQLGVNDTARKDDGKIWVWMVLEIMLKGISCRS